MTRKIRKPFSLEAYEAGAKVETRDGHAVRILATDIKGNEEKTYSRCGVLRGI